jgi:hypothetical protein
MNQLVLLADSHQSSYAKSTIIVGSDAMPFAMCLFNVAEGYLKSKLTKSKHIKESITYIT